MECFQFLRFSWKYGMNGCFRCVVYFGLVVVERVQSDAAKWVEKQYSPQAESIAAPDIHQFHFTLWVHLLRLHNFSSEISHDTKPWDNKVSHSQTPKTDICIVEMDEIDELLTQAWNPFMGCYSLDKHPNNERTKIKHEYKCFKMEPNLFSAVGM